MGGYDPRRVRKPEKTSDPLEVELVYGVRPCGTCSFFWPEDPTQQPYGPFPAFDFDSNTPVGKQPSGTSPSPWLEATTRRQAFPNPEIMDGCRKAPIMTIGINPNLTAFAPGRRGTSWAYPSFTSDDGTDAWIKYAYYYRYRTVYQECFELGFVKRFLLETGRVTADESGEVVRAQRTSASPDYDLVVRYDGDTEDTTLPLRRPLGEPRYVLLVDTYAPSNRFAKGDLLAARLDVCADERVEVQQDPIGYYEQILPTLADFERFLAGQGHTGARVRVGEDVCQLDMVACASPHWNPDFLGGTSESEDTIIENCVQKNAWAIKQLVQTRPTLLYLVGESSYDMFRDAFGNLIQRDPPLSKEPEDGAFTLLRETTDPSHPCFFRFETVVDGVEFALSTRLVVTPHFSYDTNFMPQFRMSQEAWVSFERKFAPCAEFLKTDPRVEYVKPAEKGDFVAIQIERDAEAVFEELESRFASALAVLREGYVDAHTSMAGVLRALYEEGALAYCDGGPGSPGYLTRTEGSCQFCVNERWTFPQGCPYGKPEIEPPPAGYLDEVAAAIVAAGSRKS